MIIKGENCILRPVSKDDFTKIYKWFNDDEVVDNIVGFRFSFSLEDSLEWCLEASKTNLKNIKWMIDVMGNEFRTVGFIGLYNIDLINKNAEVGIIIGDNNFRGKGIGTEALKLSCDFGFKYLGLRLIYAYILSSNTISLNLFKKNGFKEECIMHNRVFRNGLWHDIYVLTLEKEDV